MHGLGVGSPPPGSWPATRPLGGRRQWRGPRHQSSHLRPGPNARRTPDSARICPSLPRPGNTRRSTRQEPAILYCMAGEHNTQHNLCHRSKLTQKASPRLCKTHVTWHCFGATRAPQSSFDRHFGETLLCWRCRRDGAPAPPPTCGHCFPPPGPLDTARHSQQDQPSCS